MCRIVQARFGNLGSNKGQGIPAWLEAMPSDFKGKVTQLPRREDVPHPINEQLIVELCSR